MVVILIAGVTIYNAVAMLRVIGTRNTTNKNDECTSCLSSCSSIRLLLGSRISMGQNKHENRTNSSSSNSNGLPSNSDEKPTSILPLDIDYSISLL